MSESVLLALVIIAVVVAIMAIRAWRVKHETRDPSGIVSDLVELHSVSRRESWDDVSGLYR